PASYPRSLHAALPISLPSSGGGTVTSVGTGAGLTGGPITNTGTISVATNPPGITDAMIQDSAVTAAKLAGVSVDSSKIVDGQVATADLANLAVTSPKLAANSVDSTKIVDGSIKAGDVDFNQVQL